MLKNVYLDENAKKVLDKLSLEIQVEFYSLFKALEKEGKLDFPHAKKINNQLFEIRIRVKNLYRAFYAYMDKKDIIILHIFNKKTQKTPIKEIKLALKRLSKYEK